MMSYDEIIKICLLYWEHIKPRRGFFFTLHTENYRN
jgi:hypothetical protein